jgi:hypothetical protein
LVNELEDELAKCKVALSTADIELVVLAASKSSATVDQLARVLEHVSSADLLDVPLLDHVLELVAPSTFDMTLAIFDYFTVCSDCWLSAPFRIHGTCRPNAPRAQRF